MLTILYVGPFAGTADPLGLLATPGARRIEDGSIAVARPGSPPWRRDLRFVQLAEPAEAEAFVRARPVHAVVIDTRAYRPSQGGFGATPAGQLLSRLYPEGEISGALQRDRVIGIVDDGSAGVEAAYQLGLYRVGSVLVGASRDVLLERLEHVLAAKPAGRIALCLAGGGIEGIFYEVGVMRALEAFLVDRPLVDFDLFCGISAGAVLGSFLANGVGPDEIARGLSGKSARFEAIGKGDIFDPNVREVGERVLGLAKDLLTRRAGPRIAASSMARAVPTGAFAGKRLGAWLERQLTRPGMSNRFDDLRRPLFVGATDQDTAEAVVFGEGAFRHVPVHKAVRASAAMVPFYAPEQIDGRYYIDGAFSRTTNMRVAVDHGATLVILVDPLVPVRSGEAGYVSARGGVMATMQGLKALINGRFDKAVRAIREMYPDVAFHLFRPEGDEMRILSGSPMKYFYKREIEQIAYRSTVRKIRACIEQLSRDFAQHGVVFRDPEAASRGASGPEASAPGAPFEASALGVGT